MKRKLLIGLLLLLLIALGIFFFVLPALVERRLSATLRSPPYQISARAQTLQQNLFIADLHADSLLWGRDLLQRSGQGHVDLPRLLEGHVALQFFTVVTKTPRGLNIESNDDKSDTITYLALAQRWPVRTWRSLTERALYQAARLHRMAAASQGQLVIIKTAADLDNYLRLRQQNAHIVAGVLGLEGAHALDGDLRNLDALYDAGYRMVSPTHFFDTEFSGSSSGLRKGGLTPLGRELLKRMEARGMLFDLAHASPQTIDDVVAAATRPVVISHTGVKGTCPNNRNVSDEQLKGIARTGGIIGIGYWETATCGTDARAVARAMRYTADLVGVAHVALGSDFDGAVAEPFDTTGLGQIIDALFAAGFTDDEIKLIMGGNTLRLLTEQLPRAGQ